MHSKPWIDAHCHLWELQRGDYNWLDVSDPALAAIARDFCADDMRQAMLGSNVQQSILVQAATTDAETDYLLSIAQKNAQSIFGVVGWANLESENVAQRLTSLSKNNKFLGIRPMLQDIAETNWILEPSLQSGIDQVNKLGLSFDALVTTRHLEAIVALCQAHPNLRVIIDHAAKPDLTQPATSKERNNWEQGMQAIARNTNAFCKLSGLLTEMSAKQSVSKEHALTVLSPVVNQLLSWFGPQRLVWGSDWPVVNLSNSAEFWCEITNDLLIDLSNQERHQIMSENAIKFYSRV